MGSTLHRVRVALCGLLLVVGISGCQYAYRFEISGVVSGAANGGPLAGVNVMLKANGIMETPFPVITGPDGSYRASFKVMDREFMRAKMPEWSLVLSKEGYQDETLDVSPKSKPASTSPATPISMDGRLRAK